MHSRSVVDQEMGDHGIPIRYCSIEWCFSLVIKYIDTCAVAPRRISNSATLRWPFTDARCKGLEKSWRLMFGSTPWSSNSRAMSRRPYCEAVCNGAWSWLSRIFRSAPHSMRKHPTSSLPSLDANANGVFWVPFRTSTGIPMLIIGCTTSKHPVSDAMRRGFELLLSPIWIFAP